MDTENLNCWEFKKCGREPNGSNVYENGVCPVATDSRLDGVHNGKNGGRCCWLIKFYYTKKNSILDKHLCGITECLECDFYNMVSDCTNFLVKA